MPEGWVCSRSRHALSSPVATPRAAGAQGTAAPVAGSGWRPPAAAAHDIHSGPHLDLGGHLLGEALLALQHGGLDNAQVQLGNGLGGAHVCLGRAAWVAGGLQSWQPFGGVRQQREGRAAVRQGPEGLNRREPALKGLPRSLGPIGWGQGPPCMQRGQAWPKGGRAGPRERIRRHWQCQRQSNSAARPAPSLTLGEVRCECRLQQNGTGGPNR